MAFRSNGPVNLSLPAFRGFTRRLILASLVIFFAVWMLASFAPASFLWLIAHFALQPAAVLHGEIWQLITYAFFPLGLISELLALLSMWFVGSVMEDQLGSRWMGEYFVVTTVGGGLLASLLALLSDGHAFGITPRAATVGIYPFLLALLLAFARYNAEQEILFSFVLRLKAKYLAAIYILFYLGSAIVGGDRFGALTALCAALAGWLYLRFVPRKGLGFSTAERWYGLRNAFYRNRRRSAAKKFEVYMRKQGRDVHFDADGKFLDEDKQRNARNPDDRRWMN